MLVQHLLRCTVAQTLAGRVVHDDADIVDVCVRKRRKVRLPWQEPPDAVVVALYAPFLPWRLRVTEVAVHAYIPVEQGVFHELEAPVERDRLPPVPGKFLQPV